MTKRTFIVGALAAFTLVTGLAMAAPDKTVEKKQTACPVTGKPIDKKFKVDWQGQRIYFCCNACPAEFRKDPEKVFTKIAADGVVLENIQKTCPVAGEKLGGMGKPASIDHKGRRVLFCCAGCKPDFQKDPAKYLAKLPGEQPAAPAAAPAAAPPATPAK